MKYKTWSYTVYVLYRAMESQNKLFKCPRAYWGLPHLPVPCSIHRVLEEKCMQ